ncbi:hypothetical protein [Ancylobacter lacus]|uniref:hypothetical protein n=1 Tax=Ancylobacter lacus TaxID=2579970 RepID=UPI001BCBE4B4|nr:hypothetical protein [Ancylobacter lacus]MBS7539717.1 hypothetical protein [Ancylobacter lacus]
MKLGELGTGALRGAGARAAAFGLLALALAGCGGGTGGGTDVGPMGAGGKDGQGLFGSQMQTTTVAPTSSPGQEEFDPRQYSCPKVEVRGGAAAWQVTDKADGGLRYQATLGQSARECIFARPNMTMRVGIQGRVLVGAKGGPGSLTVPLRVAVVQEGPSPKPIWTKLYTVPVQIGASETQVDFSLVADDVSFPLPQPGELEDYIVYLGFDSQAGSAEAKAKPARSRPAKPAAQKPKPVAQEPASEPPAAPASAPAAAPAASAPQAAPAQPAAQPAATPAPTATTTQPATTPQQWIGAPAPATGGFSQ